jgi:hypothetical protein
MTDLQYDEIIERLDGIESVLKEMRGSRSVTKPRQTHTNADGSQPTINLEQPRQYVPDAGNRVIHFGFCKDMTIAQCDAKEQLMWFITKWKPRTRTVDNTLWPEDGLLWNAVRTYWHEKQGTLQGGPDVRQPKTNSTPAVNDAKKESNCPF